MWKEASNYCIYDRIASINELDGVIFYPIIAASSEVSSAPWLENPPAILRYLAGPPIRRPAPLLLTDPGGSSPNGVNDFCKPKRQRCKILLLDSGK